MTIATRFVLFAALCFAFDMANSTVFLSPECFDRYEKKIECPARDDRPDEVSERAKRRLIMHLKDVMHADRVADLRNGSYRVLFPARWWSGRNSGEAGYCVVEVQDFDLKNFELNSSKSFYQVRMNEAECMAEERRAQRAKESEPFRPFKNALVCDYSIASECEHRAMTFVNLAKRGADALSSDDRITMVGLPKHPLRAEQVWKAFVYEFHLRLPRDVSVGEFFGETSCGKSRGWMVCVSYPHYANAEGRYFIFGPSPWSEY